jgi:hypothetical protein
LTLSFASGAGAVRDGFSYQYSFYGIYVPQTFSGSSSSSYSYIRPQTLVGKVNLFDSGPGSQRLVLNSFVGGSYQPSFTANLPNGGNVAYSSSTDVYGGLTAFDSFRINQDFSVTPSASAQFDHRSISGNDILYSSARVLLSEDRHGLAVGPTITSAYWPGSSNTLSHGSSELSAGGLVVYQPFRTSSTPLLNGLILQASALHSIGQADFVDQPGWKDDGWSISSSAALHFRY